MAMLMIAALCIPTFAAGDGEIKITNAANGETYTIYKMADLISHSGTSYSYRIADGWADFFNSDKAKQWFYVNDNGYLETKSGATISEEGKRVLGQDALAYAEEKTLDNAGTTVAEESGEVSFTGLDAGWYLVDSSLGVLCLIDTADPTVNIEEKNKIPDVQKFVQEDSTGNWETTNSAATHQNTKFRIRINVVAGTTKYHIYDTMTNLKLTDVNNDGNYANDFVVLHRDANAEVGVENTVDATNYAINVHDFVAASGDLTEDKQSFEVTLTDEYVTSLNSGDYIIIEYTAALTDNAYVVGDGKSGANTNDVYMTYGNASRTETKQTTTTTYAMDLIKTTSDGTLLDGATFKLYTRTSDGASGYTYTEIPVTKDDTNKYHITGTSNEEIADKIVVSGGGKTYIYGLDAGTNYYLQEIDAPEGYNILSGYSQAAIGTTSLLVTGNLDDGWDNGDGGVQIVNKTGAELPSTGGIGTTMFILIGSLLVLFSGVLLATKLRMSKMRG